MPHYNRNKINIISCIDNVTTTELQIPTPKMDKTEDRTTKAINTLSVSGSGSFEVLPLAMTLGNGSGTDFGASQCIPMGPCCLTHRLPLHLTLSVVMPLQCDTTHFRNL